jgi:hypothetical protein
LDYEKPVSTGVQAKILIGSFLPFSTVSTNSDISCRRKSVCLFVDHPGRAGRGGHAAPRSTGNRPANYCLCWTVAACSKGCGCSARCLGRAHAFIIIQQKGAKAMTRTATRIVLPLTLLTATLAQALPAQAVTLTRTFVSAAGSDANPCTITQPCATFAHA